MRKMIVVLVVLCVGVGVGTALAQKAKDATQFDPEVHHVVMENEHVRVLEVRAPVGYKSPMHAHPPLLGVSVGAGRLRVTTPDGKKQIMDLRPGQIFWLDGAEHSWEMLTGSHHVVAVEVKAANKPATK